jgi:hypothetical protein
MSCFEINKKITSGYRTVDPSQIGWVPQAKKGLNPITSNDRHF